MSGKNTTDHYRRALLEEIHANIKLLSESIEALAGLPQQLSDMQVCLQGIKSD